MVAILDKVLDGAFLKPIPVQRSASGIKTIVLGVDVGKVHDPSALVICEYRDVLIKRGDPLFGELPEFETHYQILGAERIALGTSYPDVAKRVNTLAKRLYDRNSAYDLHVVADATGVGNAVIDIIRGSIIPQVCVTAVTLTGSAKSDQSILWRSATSIGKAWLVSRLQAILQANRLHAPRDPLMEAMVDELKSFEVHISATGHESSGAFSTGTHDDLVCALGLAVCSDSAWSTPTYGPGSNSLPSARL